LLPDVSRSNLPRKQVMVKRIVGFRVAAVYATETLRVMHSGVVHLPMYGSGAVAPIQIVGKGT